MALSSFLDMNLQFSRDVPRNLNHGKKTSLNFHVHLLLPMIRDFYLIVLQYYAQHPCSYSNSVCQKEAGAEGEVS